MRRDTLHLTLAFLGEVAESRLDRRGGARRAFR
jgi:2'-5' RNA ligase